MKNLSFQDRSQGFLVGTAVGDSLGLPAEGLSRTRIAKFWKGVWRQRLILKRGMTSDDTDHTVMTVQSLLAHPHDAHAFRCCLSWKLRWWLIGLPAGIGLATLKSILRLWSGVKPQQSGVMSAGNGPAMRSGIIGFFHHDQPERTKEFVTASTKLTHRDPRALNGAMAVARCAAIAASLELDVENTRREVLRVLKEDSPCEDQEWHQILLQIETGLQMGQSVVDFASSLGQNSGVSGYIYHTVPVAVFSWLRHMDNFQLMLAEAISCGGDTDTVGAIAGGLGGATVGILNIPKEWSNSILDWPRGMKVFQRMADAMEKSKKGGLSKEVGYFWPGSMLRNMVLLAAVITHGFRRLAPPYS